MSKYLVVLAGIACALIYLFIAVPAKDNIQYLESEPLPLSAASVEQSIAACSTQGEPTNGSDLALKNNNQWKVSKAITTAAIVWLVYEVYKTCIHGLLLPASFKEVFSVRTYYKDANQICRYGDPVSVSTLKLFFVAQGVKVNALEVSSNPLCEEASVCHLIFINGNNGEYDDIRREMHDFVEYGNEFKVFSFNYPKIGMRTRSPQLIIKLGIDFVGHLLQNEGAKNVVLIGRSMGGAFASYIASWFHKHNQPIGLITDRSFTCLSTVASSHCGGLPVWLCDVFLGIAGWRLVPSKVIKDIPKTWQCHYFSNKDDTIGSSGNTKKYAPDYRVKEITYILGCYVGDMHNADIRCLRVQDGSYLDDQVRVIRAFRDKQLVQ